MNETKEALQSDQNALSAGFFGQFGGQFVPPELLQTVQEVDAAWEKARHDPDFQAEFLHLCKTYTGRPSLLYYAENLSRELGGAKIYLKREDLNHTGSHKINNALGQALLAKRMGKTHLIAETGAGQHGVATATVAALMGFSCDIYMGEEDTKRQALNVYRMELLGATVHAVITGTRTLKDAVDAALMSWVQRHEDTYYLLGSAVGPHPFPEMVREFQSIIGREAKEQILAMEGKLPVACIACVGGGSNAIGLFHEFVSEKEVRLIGCEAAGKGLDTPDHAATLTLGRVGTFHGMKSYFNQTAENELAAVYSISAGLDYPGVGPEHAYLRDSGRAEYTAVTDEQAVHAFEVLSRSEGIIPAIESAHAVAYALEFAGTLAKEDCIIVNLSGRGDKDVASIARYTRQMSLQE
ncbi:MAG TPA: tryptophan synthase subunit beta [Bacillota bacterium]|nr:tryptophan synthase subunit beta [Bacillota bacterium]